jgi:FkbM family methyltransferase
LSERERLRWFRDWIPLRVKRAIHRFSTHLEPYARRAYSQEGEDLLLQRLFEGRQNGFYVDVGAHHPERFSNTCLFHQLGWRGVNIDPDPEAMRLFARARPGDINLCLGISDEPGTLTYHAFNEPALNTFDERLALERAALPGYRLMGTSRVRVERLDGVLAKALAPDQLIDFLSVDAEGFDLKVLASNDWTRFRPHCVLVEALQSSLAAASAHPAQKMLSGAGYELYAKTVNTLVFIDGRQGLP